MYKNGMILSELIMRKSCGTGLIFHKPPPLLTPTKPMLCLPESWRQQQRPWDRSTSIGGDRVLGGRGCTAVVGADVSRERLAQSPKQQQGMNCFLRKTHRVGARRLRKF